MPTATILQPWRPDPEDEDRTMAKRVAAGYWKVPGVRCCEFCLRGTSPVADQAIELRYICRPGVPDDRHQPPAVCAGCAGVHWGEGVPCQDADVVKAPERNGVHVDPRFADALDRARTRFGGAPRQEFS